MLSVSLNKTFPSFLHRRMGPIEAVQSSEANTQVNVLHAKCKKEGNVLFNDTLNTFYLNVIWCRT